MFGYTAFLLACELGAPDDVILLLLNAGCDTKATDLRQRTGLEIASDAGHGDRVAACLKSDGLERNNSVLDEHEHRIEDTSRCVARSEAVPDSVGQS